MCVGEHREGSDSEKLSLLLSLASEKEGELDQSTIIQTESQPHIAQLTK